LAVVLGTYQDTLNPYKQGHMRQAFRTGFEAADRGLDLREAQAAVAENPGLNRVTRAGWWRGYYTQRGEYA
jgi:hypothetical protein